MGAFLLTVNGQEYWDLCDQDNACNPEKYLECQNTTVDKRCYCNEEKRYYDVSKETCIAKVGSDCTISQPSPPDFPYLLNCTPNAICGLPSSNPSSFVGVCLCDDQGHQKYMATPQGMCKLKYLSPGCTERFDCNVYSHLTCNVDNICICDRDDVLQEWGTIPGGDDTELCISLAGGKLIKLILKYIFLSTMLIQISWYTLYFH